MSVGAHGPGPAILSTIGRVIAAATLVFQAGSAAQGQDAAERLLVAARAAVGERGSTRLTGLRLVGNRHTTQVRITNLEEGIVYVDERDEPIEYRFRLPDRYAHVHFVRTDLEQLFGFIGTTPQAPGARFVVGESAFLSQRLNANRLLLGVVARAIFPGDALLQALAGADAVRFEGGPSGPFRFAGTLDLDPATRVPLRFRHLARTTPHEPGTILRRFEPGDPPGGGPSPIGDSIPETEVTMVFDDRREVDGFLLPFLVRTSAKGIVIEVLTFDRIEVNPPFTDDDFR